MKVLFAFGTRPEAIKLAPVIKEMEKYKKEFEVEICITGQHRKMLDEVLAIFSLKPTYDLNIMREDQTLFDINTRVLRGFEDILERSKPRYLIVQGDTTTAFASALAAFYKKIKVAHIEAGLRTYDKYTPFPEEMNRRFISLIADLHFAPTAGAKRNLLQEGIAEDKIFVTGNTVIDALFMIKEKTSILTARQLKVWNKIQSGKIIVVTFHRRENFGKPVLAICRIIKEIVRRYKDVWVFFPVHPNPNIKRPIYQRLKGKPRVFLSPPLDYASFIGLLEKASLILTDSGGIQEEATALGKPVLVLREKTERPEAIEYGIGKLVKGNWERAFPDIDKMLVKKHRLKTPMRCPFGDGQAAKRIVAVFRSARERL